MILMVNFGEQSDRRRLEETLKGLKPVPYRIELKENRDQRSYPQNKYYFGVVVNILSEYTGFKREEMHEWLRYRFLSYQKPLPNGEMATVIQSTTDLNTLEFEQYLEEIRRWAIQDHDVLIPLPNECLEV